MKIVLLTLGSAGDVHPFIGLGIALRQRGQQVVVVTNPQFESRVRAAGLEFVPAGTLEDYQRVVDNPDLWHPLRAFKVIARDGILAAMRPMYADLVTRWSAHETILVANTLCLAARLAAETHGFRLVTVHLQPAVFHSAQRPPRFPILSVSRSWPLWLRRLCMTALDLQVIDRELAPAVNQFRAELGLPAIRHVLTRWVHGREVLGLFPDWFGQPQSDWPADYRGTGFIGWDAPAELPDNKVRAFLASGPPPLAFTAGSAMHHGADFFREAVVAARLLKRRAVLVSRDRRQLPPLPAEVLHIPYAPFNWLLPQCEVLVHHGGIGTMAQAFAAGIPQLVMPLAFDQYDNAHRARELGVAAIIARRRFRGPVVAQALTDLLKQPEVRETTARYAAQIRFDHAIDQACQAIIGQGCQTQLSDSGVSDGGTGSAGIR